MTFPLFWFFKVRSGLVGFLFGRSTIFTTLLLVLTQQASAEESLHVYLDADLTHTTDIGESLLLGLRSGLMTGQTQYGVSPVRVFPKDHQNNIRRTLRTVRTAIEDPNALAIIGGMNTPHYLKHGLAANEAGIVLFLPWSAGEILTRMTQADENFIFRVSVDDRKAASYLAEKTATHGCRRVAIVAVENGWGKANARSLQTHLLSYNITPVHEAFLRRDASMGTVSSVLSGTRDANPDCTVFVLNDKLSAFAANNLLTWEAPPDVISHWGMLGGAYPSSVNELVWDNLNIGILSTCVLETDDARPELVAQALEAAAALGTNVDSLIDLRSPPAFAHAYDLGLLLSAAVAQASRDERWAQGQEARRVALRDALETLEAPVDGLLKTYGRPFIAVTDSSPDGHEALGQEDLCLVRMTRDGGLIGHSWRAKH